MQEVSEENRRRARRLRVLKQGKILLPNGMTVIDCTVRDLSETGARLVCGDSGAIPRTFRLVFPADRSMREAEAVWRRPGQIGVRFLSDVTKAPLLKW